MQNLKEEIKHLGLKDTTRENKVLAVRSGNIVFEPRSLDCTKVDEVRMG